MASQGNISLHLVCYGEGATEEVAPQNWEGKDTRVPLPPATGAIREAHNGRVPRVTALRREVEEEWRMCHLRNRKKEKGDIGVEKEREKEEGEKLEKLEVSLVPFMIFLPILRILTVIPYLLLFLKSYVL